MSRDHSVIFETASKYFISISFVDYDGYSFSYLEPVCCTMSSSKCCFLTCIQVSQEAGQVVWYSHLFQSFEDLQHLLELTPPKDVLFVIGDWNAKVGNQETPGVTGKFGLGVQNEAGQRLIEFCQENTLVSKHLLPTTQEKTLHMDITRWPTLKSD